MLYARSSEKAIRTASVSLLEELDACMSNHFQAAKHSRSPQTSSTSVDREATTWYDCAAHQERYFEENVARRKEPCQDNFLAFTVRHGLVLFVQDKLADHGKAHKAGKPLLGYLCDPKTFPDATVALSECRSELFCLLSRHGADPNETWGSRGVTIWQDALQSHFKNPADWTSLLKDFINGGADPIAVVETMVDVDGTEATMIRRSALRYIKDRLKIVSHEHEGNRERTKWLMRPEPARPINMKPIHIPTKVATVFGDVLELLVEKGAEEKEWELMSDGSWKQVYPETLPDTPKDTQPGGLGMLKPKRSLFRRILQQT
jgi:hypothetical protein